MFDKSSPLLRRASLAEKASGAFERAILGGNLLRTSSSKDSTSPLVEETYSMNPDDYEIGKKIGHGSSAIVYLATYKPLSKPVAVKVIDLDQFERNQIDELRREIQIMSLSKHTNLLTVHGSFVKGSKLYIITPFLSAGSCLDIMKTAFKEGMEEQMIATILKQALQGLEYLHKNGLIHRDIKAGNLLIDNDGLVLLADFGVSSSLMEHGDRKSSRKTFVGTPCWMAPEVMEQSGYNHKADIWSFGITALELAYGHAPYAKFPPMKVLMLTLQNEPPSLERDKTRHKYSKTFKEMIDLCLNKDPAKRPNCDKLLAHPFFKTARKPHYLVDTMLTGLPHITERQHREAPAENEESHHRGEEWDFDEVPKETYSPTETLERQDSERSEKKVGFQIGESDVKIEQIAPKKSRFVVNSQDDKLSQRENSNISLNGTTTSSNEVRKGRFSVLEAPASQTIEKTEEEPVKEEKSEQIKTGRFEVSTLRKEEGLQKYEKEEGLQQKYEMLVKQVEAQNKTIQELMQILQKHGIKYP